MVMHDRRTFLTTALGAAAAARIAAQAPAAQPQISPVPSTRDFSRLEVMRPTTAKGDAAANPRAVEFVLSAAPPPTK